MMAISSILLISCDKNEWSNGNPSMANVYYIGFQQWSAKFDNSIKYNVNRGDTVSIPVQFYCESIHSYDVITYYYVAGTLVRGTDYNIIDQNGHILNPDADGSFSLIWPNAIKGVQRIYVKALNNATGSLMLQTFDPNAAVPISSADVSTTTNNKTDNYEVRTFSQNYKVTINVK
ncbi:MAG: hypothetical protein R2738_02115 [Bacteroides graminisolvens]